MDLPTTATGSPRRKDAVMPRRPPRWTCRQAALARARPPRARRREHGTVLLLFLLVLVVISAEQLLRRLNEEATTLYAAERLTRSGAALAEARRALLGAAVAFERWVPEAPPTNTARGPGRFTCSAQATDLVAQGEPECEDRAFSAGLLPRTLSAATRPAIPPITDASDSPMVLVMDSAFRKGAAPDPIHLGHVPSITLNGTPVVALLFAPGPVQPGESRPAGPVDLAQYLEDAENTDGDRAFVTPDPATSNDVVLAITHADLLCTIRPRIRAARLMQEAFDLDPTNPAPPTWYSAEGWHSPDGGGGTRGSEIDSLACVSPAL